MPEPPQSLWSDGPSEEDHHRWLDDTSPRSRETDSRPAGEAEPTRVRPAEAPKASRRPRSSDRPAPTGPSLRTRLRQRLVTPLALLCAVALLVSGVAIGQRLDPTQTVERTVVQGAGNSRGSLKAAFDATRQGVVLVTTNSGSGSGWVYDDRGTIVTNNHVVSDAKTIKVRFGDHSADVPAKLLGTDVSSDLAVLRVDPDEVQKLVPLPLADSDKVQTADPVLAIGYPLGLEQTATAGIISGVGRQITAQNHFSIDKVLQTDAPINPGNSGGPLLDAKGRVVGVNSQIATTGAGGGSVGIGFAIPSNTVRDVVPRLERGQSIAHAYLGVQMGDVPGVKGVVVGKVNAGGPAAKAGLRAATKLNGGAPNGDVIVGIDDTTIERADDVTRVINEHRPGDTIQLKIQRDGKEQKITVRLGDRPPSAATSSTDPDATPSPKPGPAPSPTTPSPTPDLTP